MSDAAEVGNSLVSFSTESDGSTVRIRDEVGAHEYALRSADAVSLEPASPDRFVVPVDAAVAFSTTELELPTDTSAFVRDERGEHLGQLTDDRWAFDRGTHYVELSPTMKTYVLVPDAAFTGHYPGISDFGTAPRLEFDEPTRIFVGTRSPHERPEATITVPDDPEALLTAFSALGSSLKEYSCERSWPTLRGHPPAIERGDELHVPDVLSTPDTGVTIAVPPTYADAYRVAPLVYYLGADLVPGEEAELRLDTGHTEPLRRPGRTLEESVDRLLARCLLLDSLVRVGGYYSLARYEYDEIAPHLPFYPPELHGQSIDEQLMEYLEVSFADLEPYVPEWPTTAVLRPDPADVEVVPSLLDRFARIHVAPAGGAGTNGEAAVRGPLDSVVTAHAGREPPVGEARIVPEAFENARGRERTSPGDSVFRFLGTADVAADAFERVWTAATGPEADRAGSPSVVAEGLPTRAGLRRALRESTHYLHFGGAVTDEGLVCADGVLDPATVGEVGAVVVSLTGRADVDAARTLVERGAVAGIVFESTDVDDAAGRVAGYVGAGHSLAMAAELGADTPTRFAGDAARPAAVQVGGPPPEVLDFTSTGPDEHRLTYRTETSEELQLGAVNQPLDEFAWETYSLTGAPVDQPLPLATSDVVDLYEEGYVVRLNGTVFPTAGDLTAGAVRRSARRVLDGASRHT